MENKLIAKTKRRKPEELTEQILPTNPLPNVPTFDLSQLNLLQLSEGLKESLNKKSSMFIFLRNRENTKLQLQRDKINHLIGIIEDLRLANQSIINYQAELFLSQTVLENLINGYYVKAQMEAELLARQHIDNLQIIEDNASSRFTTIDKTRAEIEQMRAGTRLTYLQGNLIEKVVNELDLTNITPAQAFVLVKALNPQADAQTDWAMKEVFINEEVEKMKAENRKIKAEAKKAEVQADLEEWETKEQMK